jgi:hypothetical protein
MEQSVIWIRYIPTPYYGYLNGKYDNILLGSQTGRT